MNYIWEALLKADKEKVSRNTIKFVKSEICSPYMEISLDDLNLTTLPSDNKIEVNVFYRFYEIFKDFCHINYTENKELREILLDILLHYLGEIDLKQGISKQEYYKKFLLKDIKNKVYGEEISSDIENFNKKERDIFLDGLITLYKTGESIYLFDKVLSEIFIKCTTYLSQDSPKYIYIYLGIKKTEERNKKLETIINTFLSIDMHYRIFWDKHFGIIGTDKTMNINEIVMVK